MKECSTCRYCFTDDINHCPSDGNRLKPSIQGDTILDGRYQLDKRLGHGGMGIVFQGRHIFLKTTFAIKVILPDLVGNDPMLVTRFRQEAMVAARMRHPNLVNVTDFGVVQGMPYLVMELIVGRSLHDILTKAGRLSPHYALQIVEAVCSGVAEAHKQGVVHRDLKPLNIMLMNDVPPSEGVKILDFGLAKIKSGELLGSFVAAQTTSLMGSPAYMAPELWSDDEPDARSDVYSMGIILFQMLAGDVPFRGGTIPAIMNKHLSQPPPTFAEQGVVVPAEIEAVVHRALAKRRDDRHESVEDFAAEFRQAVDTIDSRFDLTVPDLKESFDARTMPFPKATTEQTLAAQQRRMDDEVELLAREFQEAQQRADEARRRAEEAARKRTEEEAARKRAEEEAARKRAEEQAARERAAAAEREQAAREAARVKAQQEAARKAQEEAARKRAEEEAAQKRTAEEAARLAVEIAAVQKRAEEARQRADEEARKRTEEAAARQRAEEEARKLASEVVETKRRAEEARQRAEAEAQKRAEEEAARRQLEEEAALKRAEYEKQQRKAEEQARKIAASEADRLAREISEARRRAEEAAERAEAESQKRAEEEAARRKAEEEARRLALEVEEAQLRAEEARKRVEESRRQSEIEHQRHQDEIAAISLKAQTGSSLGSFDDEMTHVSAPPQVPLPPAWPTGPNEALPIHTSESANRMPGYAADPSNPSLQSRLHTQSSLSAISEIDRPNRLPIVIAGIGALVLIVAVLAGGIAIYSWKSSTTTAQPGGVPTTSAPTTTTAAPATRPATPDLVGVAAGSFQMGRDVNVQNPNPDPRIAAYDLNQWPPHLVSVDGFFMDRTEVTNAEYAMFIAETKHPPPTKDWVANKPPAGQELWPVSNVSIEDVNAFSVWRSKRDKVSYRLPTEEEWEYAARNGPQGSSYPWGNQWSDDRANVDTNSPKSVGSYPLGASQVGIVDLIGNVWEWTSSKAVAYPGNNISKVSAKNLVIRGGAYNEPGSGPEAITATRRSFVAPSVKNPTIGFRLVRKAS